MVKGMTSRANLCKELNGQSHYGLHKKSFVVRSLYMHISNRLVLVVLLLCVFLLLCFLCFHYYYVFIDVRLSHLNKDYLLTYLSYRNQSSDIEASLLPGCIFNSSLLRLKQTKTTTTATVAVTDTVRQHTAITTIDEDEYISITSQCHGSMWARHPCKNIQNTSVCDMTIK